MTSFNPAWAGGRSALLCSLVALGVLSGCASTVTPSPLAAADVLATSAADRERAARDVEPLKGPLTLEEAVARAIKYNLERRARMMEESFALGQLEAGNFDMLPKLMATAGYRNRDSDLVTRSTDSVTGAPSLANPFISSARSATTTDLTFTWSLLDFGQSYYAAQQNADRVLVATERRRKALHLLVQDVRTAFWRAASAQKLRADVTATIQEAESALADARAAEAERMRNPLEALRYQRQLLESVRLLEAIDQELATARIELASLANLPLAQEVRVQEPAGALSTRWMDIPVEQMEQLAIGQNADLRESFYNARIASQETRRALLRVFPGLSFNYSVKNSSDDYLINQTWRESGAQVSLNLLGLLSAPAQMRLAETGVLLADQRRMATQMAVLTQVHIARQQLASAWRQYDRADAIAKVEVAIAEQTAKREAAQTQTRLDKVAAQTSAILSQLRRYQSLALLHASASRLQATLGMEPVIDGSASQPLAELSAAVGRSLRQWEEGQLPGTAGAPARVKIEQRIELSPAPARAAP